MYLDAGWRNMAMVKNVPPEWFIYNEFKVFLQIHG